MKLVTRRTAFKSLLAGASLGGVLGSPLGLVGPAIAQMNMKMSPSTKRVAAPNFFPAAADLVFHGEGFMPMVSHLTAGTKIGIISAAANPLQLASAPTAPEKIRRTVAPSAKASLQFSKPGLYLLYDAATTRFDDKVGQVAAKPDAKQFPLPAYAIVLVTTANGRGLAPTSPHIHIPDTYMTFEPWAIVVKAGEEITFTNNDEDPHAVMPSPEPMIMPNPSGTDGKLNPALWLENMQSFAPIVLNGSGGRGKLTLSQPGLHHYYCPIHAVYDTIASTFAPLKSYGGYPFIMDGVIVVLPI